MIKARTVIFSVIGVLLLAGLLLGAGAAGYRFGYLRGAAQAAQLAPGAPQLPEGGRMLPGYGYGIHPGMFPGYWMHPRVGFSPLGVFGAALGLFFLGLLFLGLLRLIFRPFWWGHMHGRPWGGPPWAGPHGPGPHAHGPFGQGPAGAESAEKDASPKAAGGESENKPG